LWEQFSVRNELQLKKSPFILIESIKQKTSLSEKLLKILFFLKFDALKKLFLSLNN
jgi:hypothetical protein